MNKIRFTFLDAFRGMLVVSMVIYHFFWDLVFLKGVDWPWYRDYTTPTRLWQTFMRFLYLSPVTASISRDGLSGEASN